MKTPKWIEEIRDSVIGQSSLAVGKVVTHPDGRKVKIVGGYYYDPIYNRLSNHWTWREVKADGSLGPIENGYGW
jgi:hypothetical protein